MRGSRNWRLLACLLACAAIVVGRRFEAVTTPQLWAEDGPIFFRDAQVLGAHAFTTTYAGYFHLIPRLVAAVASCFDPLWAPALFGWGALAVTLYTVAMTQSVRCPLPSTPLLAFAVVLVPDAREVLLCLANIQWVTTGALLLVLISADPRTPGQSVHDFAAIVLLGMTGPAIVLFVPLFFWRAWRRRTSASVWICVAAVAVASIQGFSVAHDPQLLQVTPGRVSVPDMPAIPGIRIGASLFAGAFISEHYAWWPAVLMTIASLIGIAVLALKRGSDREERIMLAIAAVGLLLATIARCKHDWNTLRIPGFGARYFFPIQLIVLWLVLSSMHDSRRWVARLSAAAFLWIVVINAPRLHEPPLTDLNWPTYAEKIRAGGEVVVPINPVPWTFTLPATHRSQ
jgi:hypothetical protein